MVKKFKNRIKKKFHLPKEPNEFKRIIKSEYEFKLSPSPYFNSFYSKINSFKKFLNEGNHKKINYLNLSFVNMIYIYIKKICRKKNNNKDFLIIFKEIIKILSMNENDFVLMTLLIDEYNLNYSNEWDFLDLFYIGICAKEKINHDFYKLVNNYKKCNFEFDEWYNRNKNIFEKEITFPVFNQRYKELNYVKNFQKLNDPNYNSIFNYICNQKGKYKTRNKKNEYCKELKYCIPSEDLNEKEINKIMSNLNVNNNINTNINYNNNKSNNLFLSHINLNNINLENKDKSNEKYIKNEYELKLNNLSSNTYFSPHNIIKESFDNSDNDMNLFSSLYFDIDKEEINGGNDDFIFDYSNFLEKNKIN